LLLTRRRHGVPPQPVEWFRNLIACLGDRVKIRVALHGGHAIASLITLAYGRAVVYKYGCSDAEAHHLGGMPFLFWKTIQDAKGAGFETLDFGRSDLDNSGLITFKERWGATRSSLTYFRASAHPYRNVLGKHRLAIPRSVVMRLPDSALIAAGRLLYRHVA